MKVLFVSQEMPPETAWGGVGTYVDVLSEALAAAGHEVHVLSVVDDQPDSRVNQGGVTVHRTSVPAIRDPTHRFPEAWRRGLLAISVARTVRRLGLAPDVIECPEWMAEGLMIGFDGSFPLVVRLHSTARQLFPITGQGTFFKGIDGRVAMWLEETSARRAHTVISTGSNFAEVADRFRLRPEARHPIPYPVRLPPLVPMNGSAPPRVTFVGRLEHRKGPDVLLRAVPSVLESAPDAKFVFVGRDVRPDGEFPSSGWLREEGRRLGVGDALEFTGQLDVAGVQSQLGQATVCAFPSSWESFGNVVAEAAAVGRPVVVSSIPPFQELVKDGVTGRIVPAEDTDGWARAIVECLLDRPLARRMGEAGAEHIAGISEPERVAELTVRAYEHARARWQHHRRAGQSRLRARLKP